VITNVLKLNFGVQLLVAFTFLIAGAACDWTHIKTEQELEVNGIKQTVQVVYHFTLITAKLGTDYDDFSISQNDFNWIWDISN
jgi:hypothetical protein